MLLIFLSLFVTVEVSLLLNKPVSVILAQSGIDVVLNAVSQETVLGIDTETTGLDPFLSKVRLLQIATESEIFVIDCFVVDIRPLLPVFSDPNILKIFHNANFDMGMLITNYGARFVRIYDTMLGSQTLSVGIRAHDKSHSLYDVCLRYLGIELNKEQQRSDWSGELTEEQMKYAATDVDVLHDLCNTQLRMLKKLNLVETAKLECKCCIAVTQMELNGVYVDRNMWEDIVLDLEAKHHEVKGMLVKLFNAPNINLNSPKQLLAAFKGIGVNLTSTSEEALEEVRKLSPVIPVLLEYRGIAKLLGSYGWGVPGVKKRKDKVFFLERIHPTTGRIHARFLQLLAETGRFSCIKPNLQQVPGIDKIGFRYCFKGQPLPEGGANKIIVADYSQVEMRILAELANDEALMKAFSMGGDIHKATAAMMFNVPIDQVTSSMRKAAKSINFGLAYGRGPKSLAAQIEVTVEEAKLLISMYFKIYRGIKVWLEDAAATAVQSGESRTINNRLRRYEFNRLDRAAVAGVAREGKNTPIQGTSADITKLALYLCHEALQGYNAGLVNTVHDEIVCESHPSCADEVGNILKEKMEEAGRYFIKKVPIIADMAVCDTWADKA